MLRCQQFLSVLIMLVFSICNLKMCLKNFLEGFELNYKHEQYYTFFNTEYFMYFALQLVFYVFFWSVLCASQDCTCTSKLLSF